ncbi:hypothetical protein JS518_14290 [Clostridiales bacterium FE2010]|nr:hypothetical protein JS518_14290 [Clostridiales bacterium FE2010]
MVYFVPYIDQTGIHMPTYEERLGELVEAYKSIFGIDAELTAAVPDYQLLSVFAKALDDVSALVLQAYNSRNPAYASGQALDLLLPQYGITREAGESDASVRVRIRNSLAGRSAGTVDALLATVKTAKGVKDAVIYVNETDSTDSIGIPAHSIAAVTRAGVANAVAQAIYDKKAPGIGAWGSNSGTAVDAEGREHMIAFTRSSEKRIFLHLYIRVLDGGEQNAIQDRVVTAVTDYFNDINLATSLNVPLLYGIVYGAVVDLGQTFVVTDVQVSVPGVSGVIRDLVPCAWNERIALAPSNGLTIHFV